MQVVEPDTFACSRPARVYRWLMGAVDRGLVQAGAIFLLAVALRMAFLGSAQFAYDEAVYLQIARDLVEGRRFPLVGGHSSLGTMHPPGLAFLLAPAVLISREPEVVTAWIVLLASLGVAGLYLFGRRYFGEMAAVVASLLYATSPSAVWYSRKIWTPDVIPVLAILFFLGMYGTFQGKSWGPAVAVPSLMAGTQVHPVAMSLAPLAALTIVVGLRQGLVGPVAVGLAIGVATTVPYLVHLLATDFYDLRATSAQMAGDPTVSLEAARLAVLLATGWDDGRGEVVRLGGQAPPTATVPVAMGLVLVLLASFAVLAATQVVALVSRRYTRREWAEAGVVLWWALPVAMATRHAVPLYENYFTATMPAAFLCMGLVADRLARPMSTGQRAGVRVFWGLLGLAAVLSVAQVAWTLAVLRGVDKPGPGGGSAQAEVYGPRLRDSAMVSAQVLRLSSEVASSRVVVAGARDWQMALGYRLMPHYGAVEVTNQGSKERSNESEVMVFSRDEARPAVLVAADSSRPSGRVLRDLLGQEPVMVVPWGDGVQAEMFVVDPSTARGLAQRQPRYRLEARAPGIRLLGYDLTGDLHPGGVVRLLFTWEVESYTLGPPSPPGMTVHLWQGRRLDTASYDRRPSPIDRPDWLQVPERPAPGDRVYSAAELRLRGGTGLYRAEALFFDARTDAPLMLDGPDARGNLVPVGPFAVRRWPADIRREVPAGAVGGGPVLGDTFRFEGFVAGPGLPALLRPRATFSLDLYWRDLREVLEDYTVFVQLVGEVENPSTGNRVWWQADVTPGGGPTSGWTVGEVVEDHYQVVVPEGAPPGRYLLQAGMYHPATLQRLPVELPDGTSDPESRLLLAELRLE